MKKSSRIIAVILTAITLLNISCLTLLPVNAGEGQPDITKIYCTEKGIRIIWSSVADAGKYYIFRSEDSSGKWKEIKATEKTSFTDEDVTSGTSYRYSVATLKNEAVAFGSRAKYTFLSAPKISYSKASSSGITVKWKKSAGAAGYNVYRKTSSGKYKIIASLSSESLSYTDKTAKNCTAYTYAVRAKNNICESAYSSATKSLKRILKPTLVSAKNSPSGVRITWKKDAAPDKYEIYRKAEKGDWKKAGTAASSKTSFIDKKAVYGKKCTYKIRALTGKEKGSFSKTLYVRALNPKKPAIALTFDDGPYSPATNKILDSLKKYGGKATFFVVGSRVKTYRDCIKREAALGCEIGCHTYNHATLTRLSASGIKKEISSAVKEIEKYSGQKVKVVRAPGGAVNETVKANVAYPLVNWSVDTLDWKHRTTSVTVSNVKKYAKDGSIVLMHDLYIPTANAAVELIPWLTKKGYQLVTVSELFELKGINAVKGRLYTHG